MNVGFIGLGAMGQVIVPRLIAAGHTVTGWNRTRERAAPLVEQGMKWADTPAAVARASDVTFSIVTDGAAVKTVALGEHGVIEGSAPGWSTSTWAPSHPMSRVRCRPSSPSAGSQCSTRRYRAARSRSDKATRRS